MQLVRIQKLLANWGVASRRAVEKLIDSGAVSVDGQTVDEQGLQIDADCPPEIRVNGKIVRPPTDEFKFYAFNKPEGVVTTLKDERGRPTIADFLPAGRRLYPVGRLDYDSSGLLLITNHGELTNRLLHPSFKVAKEYFVRTNGQPLTPEEMKKFSNGLELDDGLTAKCQLKKLSEPLSYSVTLSEGRKRQVRRMFAFFGRKVLRLHRIRFGTLEIGNLQPGELRELNQKEKAALLQAAGLQNY